jgi:hypothetical protein
MVNFQNVIKIVWEKLMKNSFQFHILLVSGHIAHAAKKGIRQTSYFHVLGFSDGESAIC